MINEISPHRFDNQFRAIDRIEDNDYILHFRDGSVLLKKDGNGFTLPRRSDLPASPAFTGKHFLFTIDSVPCFLIWDTPVIHETDFEYRAVSLTRKLERKEFAWVCAAGHQLMEWYMSNRFCGKCGAPTHEKSDERAIRCDKCGHTVYPKISPAIITAITCNGKILLANNSNFPANRFSLIAGYADIGESLEETVIREAKEEVGLDVTNIRYYKSQPWPYSGSMMIGFFAEADENQPIIVDGKEITEAHWYTADNLPDHPENLSIAGEMIELFVSTCSCVK